MKPITYDLLEKNFPYETIRAQQEKALGVCADAWMRGKKFVVLELPTGVGKSGIAMAVARATREAGGRSVILTPQKILQQQYAAEFDDVAMLMGKATYTCRVNIKRTCAKGACGNDKKKRDACECPYREAVETAITSPIAMMNVDAHYYQTTHGKMREDFREVLIIDEAHRLEQKYMGYNTLAFREGETHRNVPKKNRAEDYIPYIYKQVARFEADLAVCYKEDEDEIRNRIQHYKRCAMSIEQSEWVVTHITEGFGVAEKFLGVELKRLYVSDKIKRDLYPMYEKVLILSATIIDIEQFCKNNGIDPYDTVFYSCESPFPVENRYIHIDTAAGSMSARNWNANSDALVTKVRGILAKHKNERGIIHTYSNKIAYFLRDALSDDRLIVKSDRTPVASALQKLKNSHNGVIVGSAMEEGLNLKGDLSRFQIIAKVPYPSLGDTQIRTRMERDRAYYTYLTILTIVQAYGRSVRNVDDYADTYILDADFSRLPRKMMPRWFAEALIEPKQQHTHGYNCGICGRMW